MSANLKNIEDQIKNLNVRDRKEFRVWYEEYESDNWDNVLNQTQNPRSSNTLQMRR
jgi:hypothetical protein